MSHNRRSSLTSIAYGTGALIENIKIMRNIKNRINELRACTKQDNCQEFATLIESYIPEWAETGKTITWQLSYPAAIGGHFIHNLYTVDQARAQEVVDDAHEQGRLCERERVIARLDALDAPLELLQAVYDGDANG